MTNCTGACCPMQYDKVDPANCRIADCPWKTKPMTNADRIRAMTDEELAKIIRCQNSKHGDECYNMPCDKCILDWLKQEVSE